MAEKRTMNDMVYIQTSLKAPKGQYNEHFKFKYRSCEDILESLKPLLKETGSILTISDEIVQVADRIYVKATATLRTASGEIFSTTAYARESDSKKNMDDSQLTGATSSYARKYALNGLFCIDDTKDADTLNNGNDGKAPTDGKGLDAQFQKIKKTIESAPSRDAVMKLVEDYKELNNYTPFRTAINKRYKEVG